MNFPMSRRRSVDEIHYDSCKDEECKKNFCIARQSSKMTDKELIAFVIKEREKVKWHYKHIPMAKQRYDIEDKLYRAIEILRLKSEPKPRLP